MSKFLTHKNITQINTLNGDEISIIERDISRKFNTSEILDIIKSDSDIIKSDSENLNATYTDKQNNLNNIIDNYNNFKTRITQAIRNKNVDCLNDVDTNTIIKKIKSLHKSELHRIIEDAGNISKVFSSNKSIIEAPMFDLSKFTNIEDMFNNCSNLVTVPKYNLDNVVKAYGMFCWCKSLENVPELNFKKLTYCPYLFGYCSSLKSIKITNETIIKSCREMFTGCYSLTKAELNFKSLELESCFNSCSNLKEVIIDTSKTKDMSLMFYKCNKLESIYLDTTSVTNMSNIFYYCSNLTKIRFNPNAGNIVDFNIYYCTGMTSDDLVNMFESLPIPKETVTITLGSRLLNKLSEEQKQIAIDKSYILK